MRAEEGWDAVRNGGRGLLRMGSQCAAGGGCEVHIIEVECRGEAVGRGEVHI